MVPEKPNLPPRGAEKLYIRNQKAKFRAAVTQTTSLLLSGQVGGTLSLTFCTKADCCT